ncbi:thiamine phosphate synthase [Candidatus Pelagibacter communis]|uniref:thiamine phosphate synthase n=1 Tax=Pelagibacter ubique TaxID=198252 RepID=UPI00092D2F72|nr:thiamine phosphate synthase [Candidatus Pelagibacter ubique]
MHINNFRKYYFINKFDTKNIDKQTLNTGIIYRNYEAEDSLSTIIKLKNYCKKKGHKFFLSNNVKLAINLNLDGAYIPSFNKSTNHLSYSKSKNFLLIGSAHNNKEIKIKERQGVSILFFSSVFKKNKNYLGLNKFKLLTNLTNKKVIALGGITNENLKKLSLINCKGFAGISYFQKKTAPQGGRLNYLISI